MATISKECSSCGRYYRQTVEEKGVSCPHCGKENAPILSDEWTFPECPFCHCKTFYRQKDFNQVMGCLIVLVGAVLVPFTYGLSLPVLILLDWLLYGKVKDVVVCYRCGAQFRQFHGLPAGIGGFDHHTAELYETT
ncbi:MAG: hypothetical protein ACE5GH_04170 [Fidelibacterota bacterium]